MEAGLPVGVGHEYSFLGVLNLQRLRQVGQRTSVNLGVDTWGRQV